MAETKTPQELFAEIRAEYEKSKEPSKNEKAAKEFGPLKTFARSAANTALFGGGERLASWMRGSNVEDEREISKRAREENPTSAFAGDIGGNILQTLPMSIGATAAVPALAANTVRAALMREGAVGAASALGQEAVSAADKGEFSPSNVVLGGATGAVGGAAGVKVPEWFGHAKTIASKHRNTRLTDAEHAGLNRATTETGGLGFRGDAALDLAQRARWTEDPGLAELAANIERTKLRAGPAAGNAQEQAFRAQGLDQMMERSVPSVAVRGVNRGMTREYPDISGKAVGQSRNAIPEDAVLNPSGPPLPRAAQEALDEAYRSRDELWQTQNARGTWSPDGPRPQPQRNERKMWEDVLDPRRTPLSREDLRQTRAVVATTDPVMDNRVTLEQLADDFARVRGAVRDAPATPSSPPWTVSAGIGLPPSITSRLPAALRPAAPFAGISKPLQPTKRHARALQVLRDNPDIIGQLTMAQQTGGASTRAILEELIDSLSR